MGLAEILQWNLSLFFLILSRWTGLIMLAPVFGARGVPALVKLGLALSFSVVIYPLIWANAPQIPVGLLPYVALVIKETLVGLVIGFVISAFTAVLLGAGQLIDFQMGFTLANYIDPVYGTQGPMMGNFQLILATMLLLATNAHYYLIAAMVRSYAFIPINVGNFPPGIKFYIELVGSVFALAAQLALPVFGALLVADLGVGLLARTMPQLNIFSIMFPVKVIFGFVLLILAVPFFGETVARLFDTSMDWVQQIYRGWRM